MAGQVPCSRCGRPIADSYPSCPWCGLRRSAGTAEIAPAREARAAAPRESATPAPSSEPAQPLIAISISSRDIRGAAVGAGRWAVRHPRSTAGGVAALVVAAGLPLILETAFLFDLLVAVACFGILARYLVEHAGTTSSLELRRLVG